MPECKLCVFEIGSTHTWDDLGIAPTVCLIALDEPPDPPSLKLIVVEMLKRGAVSIATYGPAAQYLEDEIDSILESGDKNWLEVPTTRHTNEALADIANLLVYATYRGNLSFRCLVLWDRKVEGGEELLEEMQRLCKG